MALEVMIKDILKWKMEAYEERNKTRDDKIMGL
jgi:hypothetical protein